MTLQFYSCKILLERAHPDRLRDFLRSTWRPRQLARHATWSAMALYLAALAVLAFEILPTLPAAIVASVMGVGALSIIVVWQWLLHALHQQLRSGSGRRRSCELSPMLAARGQLRRMGSGRRVVGVVGEELGGDDDEDDLHDSFVRVPFRVDDL